MTQVDLFGKSKRIWKFKRIFGKKPKGADSSAEAAISGFLRERGILFLSRVRIVQKGNKKAAAIGEEEKLRIVRSSCPDSGKLDLILGKFPLSKVHPELFRTDFLIEGRNDRVFVEYLGLYNPSVKVDKKTIRKRHYRQVAFYTFVKTPLKKELYRKVGAEAIFLTRNDLGKLEEALSRVFSIDQSGTVL